jgi:DNA-binding Xre family transcriptional regulator
VAYQKAVLTFEELMALEQIAAATAPLPVCERLMAFMDFRRWNRQRFTLHTGLDESTYSKLKHNQRKRLDMRTFIAICVGLRLPLPIVEDLLHKAGMAFSNSLEDQAYRYVILMFNGAGHDACNAFLRRHKIPQLGTFAKDELAA